MGFFDIFKKKAVKPQTMQEQQENTRVNRTTIKPTKKKEPAVDDRPWVDKYYMSGYDVGEMKGYTDLPEKPRCDEEGTYDALKWMRYANTIVITELLNKEVKTINIPQTINGYVVAGIERMAFLNHEIQFVTIPDTVQYIGGMAAGFTSRSVFSYDEEGQMRKQSPFAENHPTSPFMDKIFYSHIHPKTTIIGSKNTIAEKYAVLHHLPFSATTLKKDNSQPYKKVIHSAGVHIIGELYEEVTVEIRDGKYCYVTRSMTDMFNAGGDCKEIPKDFIVNGKLDEDALLDYIAVTHTYMETLSHRKNSAKLCYICRKPLKNANPEKVNNHLLCETCFDKIKR